MLADQLVHKLRCGGLSIKNLNAMLNISSACGEELGPVKCQKTGSPSPRIRVLYSVPYVLETTRNPEVDSLTLFNLMSAIEAGFDLS